MFRVERLFPLISVWGSKGLALIRKQRVYLDAKSIQNDGLLGSCQRLWAIVLDTIAIEVKAIVLGTLEVLSGYFLKNVSKRKLYVIGLVLCPLPLGSSPLKLLGPSLDAQLTKSTWYPHIAHLLKPHDRPNIGPLQKIIQVNCSSRLEFE